MVCSFITPMHNLLDKHTRKYILSCVHIHTYRHTHSHQIDDYKDDWLGPEVDLHWVTKITLHLSKELKGLCAQSGTERKFASLWFIKHTSTIGIAWHTIEWHDIPFAAWISGESRFVKQQQQKMVCDRTALSVHSKNPSTYTQKHLQTKTDFTKNAYSLIQLNAMSPRCDFWRHKKQIFTSNLCVCLF